MSIYPDRFDGRTELTAAHMNDIIRRVRSCAMTTVPPLKIMNPGDARILTIDKEQLFDTLSSQGIGTPSASNPNIFTYGRLTKAIFPPEGLVNPVTHDPAQLSFAWQELDIIAGLGRIKPNGIVGDGIDKNPAYELNEANYGALDLQIIDPKKVVKDPEGTPSEGNIGVIPTVARFYQGYKGNGRSEWLFDSCCRETPLSFDSGGIFENPSTLCQTAGTEFRAKNLVLWPLMASIPCQAQCGPYWFDPSAEANEQCGYVILRPNGDPRGGWEGSSAAGPCRHENTETDTLDCGPPCTAMPTPPCVWKFKLTTCTVDQPDIFVLTEQFSGLQFTGNWSKGIKMHGIFLVIFSGQIPEDSPLYLNCCAIEPPPSAKGDFVFFNAYVFPYDYPAPNYFI